MNVAVAKCQGGQLVWWTYVEWMDVGLLSVGWMDVWEPSSDWLHLVISFLPIGRTYTVQILFKYCTHNVQILYK